jgi:hypothetical protein
MPINKMPYQVRLREACDHFGDGKMNSRRRAALEGLNTADWRALIYRELQADN